MSSADAAQHACASAEPPAVAVVLAGGQARRLGGGDKALAMLGGATLLDHVLARVRPQVGAVVLSANGDAARFGAWGLPVVADAGPGFAGPLAGVLAGMEWARLAGAAELLSVAVDVPFVPGDLLLRLRAGRGDRLLACAASGGRAHPVAALWPVALAPVLAAALRGGVRRMLDWMRARGLAEVDFPELPDPFVNVNTPADLAAAAVRLTAPAAK